jgi:DNA-directed RNA polymerase subunit RPC12/RpoP
MAAPTSEERREIAERIRKTHGIMAFVEALGIDLDSDWCWTDVSRRVADLIDPTCHDVSSQDIEIKCSACGAYTEIPSDRGAEIGWLKDSGHHLNYCPNCGGRLVG